MGGASMMGCNIHCTCLLISSVCSGMADSVSWPVDVAEPLCEKPSNSVWCLREDPAEVCLLFLFVRVHIHRARLKVAARQVRWSSAGRARYRSGTLSLITAAVRLMATAVGEELGLRAGGASCFTKRLRARWWWIAKRTSLLCVTQPMKADRPGFVRRSPKETSNCQRWSDVRAETVEKKKPWRRSWKRLNDLDFQGSSTDLGALMVSSLMLFCSINHHVLNSFHCFPPHFLETPSFCSSVHVVSMIAWEMSEIPTSI